MVHCEQCYSVLINANRRLHIDATVRRNSLYKASSELTYHWELFAVAGANSYIPRCKCIYNHHHIYYFTTKLSQHAVYTVTDLRYCVQLTLNIVYSSSCEPISELRSML